MPDLESRFHDCRPPLRAGLTRTETLVALVILLLLGAVLGVFLRSHFKQAELNRAVECAHTLDAVLAQYATDNNGVYPVGEGTPTAGKSEGIARNLLENNYVPETSVFTVGSTAAYTGKASDFSDIAASNLSWDFTAGATAMTGITASVSDYLPVVYTTGETVDYASARGRGLVLTPSGSGPFGHEGIIAAYKGGFAYFIPARPSDREVSRAFILSNFNDPGPYTQIRP